MQVSFTSALEDGRAHHAIGRVRAVGRWRGGDEPGAEADRRAVLLRALVREAEDYGADALIEVNFEVEEVAERRYRRRAAHPPRRLRRRGALRRGGVSNPSPARGRRWPAKPAG